MDNSQMTDEQEMKMRCYNAMGHGKPETERLESAKALHQWLKEEPEPTQPE